MSRKPVVLITGAAGEIGHALIQHLAEDGSRSIVTLDVTPLEQETTKLVQREITGSILEKSLLERLLTQYEVDLIYHLAALLSTRS